MLPEWLWESERDGGSRDGGSRDGGSRDGGSRDGARSPSTRGGVELGFLSGTTDAELAMKYAAEIWPSS